MDIKRAVVACHTDRCVVEPSEPGALHAFTLESCWATEETENERSRKGKVANETWHQGHVRKVLNASFLTWEPFTGAAEAAINFVKVRHLIYQYR